MSAPQKRFVDLSAEEAQQLMKRAVASGVTQAGLLILLLWGLLITVAWVLR